MMGSLKSDYDTPARIDSMGRVIVVGFDDLVATYNRYFCGDVLRLLDEHAQQVYEIKRVQYYGPKKTKDN